MNDKIRVNLNIASGLTLPAWIHPADEEKVRKAAEQVRLRLNAYNDKYQDTVSREALLAMVAYEFALKSLEQEKRNETEPYIEKIKELTSLLDNYFQE